MKNLTKPTFAVSDIINDCCLHMRNKELSNNLKSVEPTIISESARYENLGSNLELYKLTSHSSVGGQLSKDEMCKIYSNTFVANANVRQNYYDRLLSMTEICPICGIGRVSTLDHYLAKTLYPTFAITPTNLIPSCKDCNKSKGTSNINSISDMPFHPYYEDIDNIIWLKANIFIKDNTLVANYSIDSAVKDISQQLYERLNNQLNTYDLKNAYAAQSANEIANSISLWKQIFIQNGEHDLAEYFYYCLDSRENVQKNTWHTALLRGLIQNIKLFEQLT